MSEQEKNLLLVKGIIHDLPAESQECVNEIAEHIRRVIAQAPKGEGILAFTLVAAENANVL